MFISNLENRGNEQQQQKKCQPVTNMIVIYYASLAESIIKLAKISSKWVRMLYSCE